MLKLSKIAVVSVLLFASACTSTKSGAGKDTADRHHSSNHVVGTNSYCYCPAKHGTVGVTHFNFDSSEVLPDAKKIIDEEIAKCVAARLAEDDEIRVLITGHADKRGTQEYNLALGTRRADATKNYLHSTVKDIQDEEIINLDDRFCTSSKGKDELVDNGDTEVAHAKNRRSVIEFVEECN